MQFLVSLLRRLRESFPGQCVQTFFTLQGVDRSMAIASQAFTALIPLLILVSALSPVGSENLVANGIVRRFGLAGDSATAVRELFAHTGSASTGLLSVVLLLFSAVSLVRRMQRMYLATWRLEPAPGVRGSLNATLALAVLLIEIGLLYLARTLVRGLPLDDLFALVASGVAGLVLWTAIPWLLLDRRLRWQRLVPAGVLASVCVSVYGLVSTIYMPHLMESYSVRYGLFGVTLALVGWLLAVALIVVTATIVAAEFDRSTETWARVLRTHFGLDEPAAAAAGDGPVLGSSSGPGAS